MRLRILGPVEIRNRDEKLLPARRRTKALLGMLSLRANTAVSVEWIIDGLWGERPPPSAAANLRSYVGDLRRVLGTDGGPRISSGRGSYALTAGPDGLDTLAFDSLAAQGHDRLSSGDHELAVERLTRAAGLWRGPVLDGLLVPDAVQPMIRLLDERRIDVIEDCVQARLALGQHAELVAELRSLTGQHELRERLWGQLMLALYRCGRQVEAVEAYRQLRRLLDAELGVWPSQRLRLLHERILRADPELRLPERLDAGTALSAVPPVPRQLPPDVSTFVGRAPQLQVLDDAMRAAVNSAVVITAVSGTAGVGKTALAVHWAHRAAHRFPDGCLYADLRGYGPEQPLQPAQALAGFLRGLGVPGAGVPHDLAEQTARYRTLLAGRRMLVLLDNARTAEQVRPLLPGTPGCLVLVTSRDDLAGLVARDGAHRVELDLMLADEAVTLLRGLIGARVDQEPDAADALANCCARLPLALRIAADLAGRRPGAPLAELVAELANRQRGLDVLDAGGDARTAVRAVFDWSYQALETATSRAFRLLALHPGRDFDLRAAAALTGTEPGEARQLVDRLLRAHLLQHNGHDRLAMHDLLRAYATADQVDGSHVALTRLFDHYARAAAAAEAWFPLGRRSIPAAPQHTGPPMDDAAQATRWLDTERANLVAVTAFCAEHGWPAHACELSQALRPYLEGGSHRADALAVHGHALRAAREASDRLGEAAALNNLGGVYLHLGRFREAVTHLRLALTIRTETGDRTGEARTANNLAIVHTRLSHYREAGEQYRRSILISQELGDPGSEAMALANLAFVHYRLARYADTIDCHQRALEIFHRLGAYANEGVELGNLGTVFTRLGRYEEAAEHLQGALVIAREAGDRGGEGYLSGSLGELHTELGEYHTAGDHLELALRRHRELGDRASEATVLALFGDLHRGSSDCHEAMRAYRRALELNRELGERSQEVQSLNGIGATFLAMCKPDSAHSHYHLALNLARATGIPYEQGIALDGLARVASLTGDPATATDLWRQALDIYSVIGVPQAGQVRRQLAGELTAALPRQR